MAIIININLSSGERWMVFGGPRAIMTRAWLGPAVGFSEAKRGTQTSKPSAQWNITSFSLLLFTRSQWRSVRAKAFCRASQNENAWCRTALTGDHQAGIIKSVISPACSLELGHMVELFRLMEKKKYHTTLEKWLRLIKLSEISGVVSLLWPPIGIPVNFECSNFSKILLYLRHSAIPKLHMNYRASGKERERLTISRLKNLHHN